MQLREVHVCITREASLAAALLTRNLTLPVKTPPPSHGNLPDGSLKVTLLLTGYLFIGPATSPSQVTACGWEALTCLPMSHLSEICHWVPPEN